MRTPNKEFMCADEIYSTCAQTTEGAYLSKRFMEHIRANTIQSICAQMKYKAYVRK